MAIKLCRLDAADNSVAKLIYYKDLVDRSWQVIKIAPIAMHRAHSAGEMTDLMDPH